jgi:Caulimovirus viroplasmin/PIF1-like helicase
MAKSQDVAWVVFRGRKPGVYHSWDECNDQVTGFPKGKQIGFKTFLEASLAWEEWQRKIAVMLAASAPPQPPPKYENLGRRWQEPLSPASPWIKSPARQQMSVAARPAVASQVNPTSGPWQPSTSQVATSFSDPPSAGPLMPGYSFIQKLEENTICYPQLQSPPQTSQDYTNPLQPLTPYTNLKKLAGYVDLTSPSPPPPPPEFIPAVKRSANYMGLIDEPDNEEPAAKRVMREMPDFTEEDAPAVLTAEERYELDQLERRPRPNPIHDETQIELSPEQEIVVSMAMRKNNIFLTGAAGCGKTVTLKAILAKLKKKKRGGNVQVVAPTGIAALPLEGKTTYSFAGASEHSLRKRKMVG